MKKLLLLIAMAIMTQMSMATIVTGKVYSTSDSAFVYADVYYTNTESGQVYSSFTEWSGYWLDIPEGEYTVLVDDIFDVYQDGNFGPISVSGSDLELNFLVSPIDFSNVDNFIAGTVRDAESLLPIEGASVEVRLDGNVTQSAITGSDGLYLFEDLLPRNYALLVQADGYDFYVEEFTMGETTELNRDVLLQPLTPENSVVVSGVVTSFYTGDPVSDVAIKLQAAVGSFSEELQTDAEGRFSFPLVPENSTYILDASKEGYEFQRTLLNTGTADVTFDIILRADVPENAGTISGSVRLANGSLVPGALLEFLPLQESFSYDQVITDLNGTYAAQLLPGEYIVRLFFINETGDNVAYISEYYNNTTDINEAEIITLDANGEVTDIDFEITMPEIYSATITGRVTDSSGEPLQFASVIMYGEDPIFPGYYSNISGAYSDANGNFSLSTSLLAGSGSVKLGASVNGHFIEYYNEKATLFEADEITIGSDTTITGVDFTLTPYSSDDLHDISGQVVEEGSGEAILDAIILLASTSGYFDIASVDSFGYYLIPNVPTGDYYMQFLSSRHIPEYYNDALNWEDAAILNVDSDQLNIDAQLMLFNPGNQAGNITGITKDENGQPLAGVTVMVMNADEEMLGYAISDNQGRYDLHGLGSGDFSMVATFMDHNSENLTVTMDLAESIRKDVDIQLDKTVTGISDGTIKAEGFSLEQNFPNPFNPSTTIRLQTATPGKAELVIFNVAGQKVRTLFSGNLQSGSSQFVWNGLNDAGNQLGSGVYFYQLRMNGKAETRSMLLVK
jgi:protocatechuate 3,4-dioxygenase beta subunit